MIIPQIKTLTIIRPRISTAFGILPTKLLRELDSVLVFQVPPHVVRPSELFSARLHWTGHTALGDSLGVPCFHMSSQVAGIACCVATVGTFCRSIVVFLVLSVTWLALWNPIHIELPSLKRMRSKGKCCLSFGFSSPERTHLRSLCLLKLFAHIGQGLADACSELMLADRGCALSCDGVAWLDDGGWSHRGEIDPGG